MSLSAGDKLGPYEIVEPIGKGGMGEVYRARDTRLGRDVAIKVSAQKFGERFEREARVISSLNHPNISTLYDVGDNYLVMEFVEGQTLRERIRQAPIPLEEALQFARQIAAALDAAHEKGIVHRDLKPGNVMVKEDGSVKVMDFGLAKVARTSQSADGNANSDSPDDPDLSPTLSMSPTQVGVVLGTAAYMAPEQARGKPVDKRADIWSFGVVLYEMVTGKKLFAGEDMAETLAAVVHASPDFRGAKPELQRILTACLQKNPRDRLSDIKDWELLVDPAETAGAQTVPANAWLQRGLWGALVVSLVAALSLGFVHFRETTFPRSVMRFRLEELGEPSTSLSYIALSPDGQQLVYTSSEPDGVLRLWIRSLNTLEPRVLSGTDLASSPFWSPDSRTIGFGVGSDLKMIEATGGSPPVTLATLKDGLVGSGAWSSDDVILFTVRGGPGAINRISSAGGAFTPVTRVDPERGDNSHTFPGFLPDGRHFLYNRGGREAGTYIGSINDSPEDPPSKRLISTSSQTLFVPSSSASAESPKGYLLFCREGTLLAQPFDPDALQVTGDAVPFAEGVGFSGPYAYLSASANGVLAYRGGGGLGQFTWLDRRGDAIGRVGDSGAWGQLALAPDAAQVVASRTDGQADLWMMDLARGNSTRFTFEAGPEQDPVWSPDGSRVAYSAGNSILQRATNGAGEPETLLATSGEVRPQDWFPDGSALLYVRRNGSNSYDLMVLTPERNGEQRTLPYLSTDFPELQAQFSPDGRWVAYVTPETGGVEVFVRPFTPPDGASSSMPPGGKWKISNGGGWQPRWNPNGRELLYLSPSGMMMSVAVDGSGPEFEARTPTPLFEVDITGGATNLALTPSWDIAPDGQRFLVNLRADPEASQAITVVLNWEAELDR